MSSIETRLTRLEAKRPPEPVKPWATFLWCSSADDPALEAAEKSAEAECRNIMVIRLVSPELDANGRAIKRNTP